MRRVAAGRVSILAPGACRYAYQPWSPGPPILMLGGLVGAVCFYRVVCGRSSFDGRVMLAVGLGWTPPRTNGADKPRKFLILMLLATVAPFFLIQ